MPPHSKEEPLLTILQISDLHIGELDATSGDAKVSKAIARVYAHFSWLDGVLGHHARGLEDLDDFYWNLADANKEPPLVLVTGDVTRIGGGSEFDSADDFLISQLELSEGRWVGLHCKNWREWAIPGNHDHWSGLPVIWGGPGSAFDVYFSEFSASASVPPIREIPLFDDRVLQVARINTDANVWPFGLNRARAVGAFQSQLTAAKARLGTKKNGQIRILMMHHSWHQNGWLLSIDSATRRALEEFLVATQTQVVLTGHTHEPLLKSFTAKHDGESQDVLECRCGTTTQADEVPVGWRNLLGTFPKRKWACNSLLLHRLYREDDRVRWDSMSIMRKKRNGFSNALDRTSTYL